MPIARHILEIDPLTPVYRFVPGLMSLMAGEFPDALPSFDEAIKLDPNNAMLLWCRAQVLTLCRRDKEAIAQFNELQKAHPDHLFAQLGSLMQAALASDRESAARIATDDLKQIAACDPHYSWFMAECYSLLGDSTSALQWLETAMDKGFINYPMIGRWDPLLINVRQSQNFDAFARRVQTRWENFEV
jgi:non-specific serine/threonine protein kinase